MQNGGKIDANMQLHSNWHLFEIYLIYTISYFQNADVQQLRFRAFQRNRRLGCFAPRDKFRSLVRLTGIGSLSMIKNM